MADCLLLNTLIRSVRASRARARHSASVNNSEVFVTNTQSVPSSYRKQHKIDDELGNRLSSEDAALFEAALHDVALLKNQLLQLQNIVNNSSVADKLVSGNDAEHLDRINVERLIRENDALRRELAEKDRIINTLRSKMPIN